MLLENISLGRTLEIYVDREGYRYRLVSKVEDAGPRRVCVTAIAAQGKVFLFRPEDEIKIVYRDSEQMWEWPRVKAGLAKLDGVPIHFFEITNKGQSFNRRNAYRVLIGEDVMIGYYEEEGNKQKYAEEPEQPVEQAIFVDKPAVVEDVAVFENLPIPAPVFVKAYLKDLSETGIGIFTNTNLEIDDSFFLSIPSPFGDLKAKASVVRINEMAGTGSKYNNYYGCTFLQADKKIMKYIFEVQRENLKKQKEQQAFEENMRLRRRDLGINKKK